MTVDYRVRLDAFQGPLDLLLYLIRRAEVDIADVPIATIADQYLAHLGAIERIDIDVAGEFLVMAATLMEIKSRMLAPPDDPTAHAAGPDPASAGTAADPRAELVRQLLEYKRFRDAAESLDRRRLEWERRFPVRRIGIDDESLRAAIEARADEVELEDIDLLDLVRAHARIVETVNLDRLGDHTVVYDDTPIELHAADLLDRLGADDPEGRGVDLVSIFSGRTRSQMIGLFLAVLELVRRREVAVTQPAAGGPIRVAIRTADEAPRTGAPGAT